MHGKTALTLTGILPAGAVGETPTISLKRMLPHRLYPAKRQNDQHRNPKRIVADHNFYSYAETVTPTRLCVTGVTVSA